MICFKISNITSVSLRHWIFDYQSIQRGQLELWYNKKNTGFNNWFWPNLIKLPQQQQQQKIVIHNSLSWAKLFIKKKNVFLLWNEGQFSTVVVKSHKDFIHIQELAGIITMQLRHIKTCHSPDIIDLVQRVIKSYCELNKVLDWFSTVK